MSRKEQAWLACATKSCCHAAFVVPTGRDVWRIARALDAPPSAFVRYFQPPTARGDVFALDASGPRYRLALAKAQSQRRMAPCTFLMKTRRGQHRCGLGELRPQACRAFPSEVVGGVVCVRNDGGCTCRTWTIADVDVAEEYAAVAQREVEADEYREVVDAWNARVTAAGDGARFEFGEFCDFLLQAYDELA